MPHMDREAKRAQALRDNLKRRKNTPASAPTPAPRAQEPDQSPPQR
jgi:hypothetical protein